MTLVFTGKTEQKEDTMEYKDIETFLGIVRTRSITKTAESLFLSQSTVSNRLKHLEDELGYKLVQRGKGQRAVQFTQYGKEFIPIAERWSNLFEETKLLKEKNRQIIRIGTNESAFYEFLCDFTLEFMETHPGTKLSIQISDSSHIYDLAEDDLIDYGFASYESYRNEIISKCINKQKIYVISYDDDPGDIKKISPAELEVTREICFTGGHFANFTSWRSSLTDNQYAYLVDINSPRAALPYLKKFHGWALCPLSLAKSLSKDASLQIYELEDPPEDRRIYMIRHTNSNVHELDFGREFEKELDAFMDLRS